MSLKPPLSHQIVSKVPINQEFSDLEAQLEHFPEVEMSSNLLQRLSQPKLPLVRVLTAKFENTSKKVHFSIFGRRIGFSGLISLNWVKSENLQNCRFVSLQIQRYLLLSGYKRTDGRKVVLIERRTNFRLSRYPEVWFWEAPKSWFSPLPGPYLQRNLGVFGPKNCFFRWEDGLKMSSNLLKSLNQPKLPLDRVLRAKVLVPTFCPTWVSMG